MSTGTATGEMQRRCQFCDTIVNFPLELKYHVKCHTGDKSSNDLVSEKASFVYGKYRWSAHKRARAGDKLSKGQLSVNSFSYTEYPWNHKRADSIGRTRKQPFENELCEKSLVQIDMLRGCVGGKPHKCQSCQTQCATAKNHKRTDTAGKRHKCQVCEKSFARSSNLKSHMLIHTGEKPYRCHLCVKSFKQNGHLKRHLTTHQVHQFNAFNLLRKLKTLKRIHTNDKLHLIYKEPATDSSALIVQFQTRPVVHPLELKLEGVIASSSSSTSKTTEKSNETSSRKLCNASNELSDQSKLIGIDECLSINRLKLSQDDKLFYERSFGCGICDEILEIKENFLEHCSGHGLASPDKLLLDLFR